MKKHKLSVNIGRLRKELFSGSIMAFIADRGRGKNSFKNTAVVRLRYFFYV